MDMIIEAAVGEVKTSWFSAIINHTATKVVGGVVAATGVGYGGYKLYTHYSNGKAQAKVEVKAEAEEPKADKAEAPKADKAAA